MRQLYVLLLLNIFFITQINVDLCFSLAPRAGKAEVFSSIAEILENPEELESLRRADEAISLVDTVTYFREMFVVTPEVERKQKLEELLIQEESDQKRSVIQGLIKGKSKEDLANYIKFQGAGPQNALSEVVSNAIDAILVKNDQAPIGRFGMGAFQILGQLKDIDDMIVYETYKDGKKHIITLWKKGPKLEDIIYTYKKEEAEEGAAGTKVIVKKKGLNKQELTDYLKEKYECESRVPVRINGQYIIPADLKSFGVDDSRFDRDLVDIRVEEDGYVISDTGNGMDEYVLFFNLLRPRSGEKIRETDKVYPSGVRYKLDETVESSETEVVFLLNSVKVKSVKIKQVSFNVPRRIAIELPLNTKIFESRGEIEITDTELDSIYQLIEDIAEYEEMSLKEKAQVINGILTALKSEVEKKGNITAVRNKVRTLPKLKKLIQDLQEQYVLVNNTKRFFEALNGTRINGREIVFIDSFCFQFDPSQAGFEILKDDIAQPGWRVFLTELGQGGCFVDKDSRSVVIDKKTYEDYKEKGLLSLLKDDIDVYIGYGKRPEETGTAKLKKFDEFYVEKESEDEKEERVQVSKDINRILERELQNSGVDDESIRLFIEWTSTRKIRPLLNGLAIKIGFINEEIEKLLMSRFEELLPEEQSRLEFLQNKLRVVSKKLFNIFSISPLDSFKLHLMLGFVGEYFKVFDGRRTYFLVDRYDNIVCQTPWETNYFLTRENVVFLEMKDKYMLSYKEKEDNKILEEIVFFDKKSNLEKKIIMEFKEKDLLTVALSQPEINILKEDIRDEDEFSSQLYNLYNFEINGNKVKKIPSIVKKYLKEQVSSQEKNMVITSTPDGIYFTDKQTSRFVYLDFKTDEFSDEMSGQVFYDEKQDKLLILRIDGNFMYVRDFIDGSEDSFDIIEDSYTFFQVSTGIVLSKGSLEKYYLTWNKTLEESRDIYRPIRETKIECSDEHNIFVEFDPKIDYMSKEMAERIGERLTSDNLSEFKIYACERIISGKGIVFLRKDCIEMFEVVSKDKDKVKLKYVCIFSAEEKTTIVQKSRDINKSDMVKKLIALGKTSKKVNKLNLGFFKGLAPTKFLLTKKDVEEVKNFVNLLERIEFEDSLYTAYFLKKALFDNLTALQHSFDSNHLVVMSVFTNFNFRLFSPEDIDKLVLLFGGENIDFNFIDNIFSYIKQIQLYPGQTENFIKVMEKLVKIINDPNILELGIMDLLKDYYGNPSRISFDLVFKKIMDSELEIPRELEMFYRYFSGQIDEFKLKVESGVQLEREGVIEVGELDTSRGLSLASLMMAGNDEGLMKRLSKERPRISKPRSKASIKTLRQYIKEHPTYNQEDIEHQWSGIIEGQSSPDICLRELVQNSRDAILEAKKTGKKVSERVDIDAYFDKDEKESVVSVQDYVGIIDLSKIVKYLLKFDSSDKGKVMDDESLGMFGKGFFTVFEGADEVRITTGVGGKVYNIVIDVGKNAKGDVSLTIKEFKKLERVRDKSGGLFRGTLIQRVKKHTGENVLEQAGYEMFLFNIFLHAYVSSFSDQEVEIYYEDECLNKVYDEIAEQKIKVKEDGKTKKGQVKVFVHKQRDIYKKSKITVGGAHLSFIKAEEESEWLELVPKVYIDFLLRYGGIRIDLPSIIKLTSARTDILEDQKQVIKSAIAMAVMRAVMNLKLKRNVQIPGLPEDLFMPDSHLGRDYAQRQIKGIDLEKLRQGDYEEMRKLKEKEGSIEAMTIALLNLDVGIDEKGGAITVADIIDDMKKPKQQQQIDYKKQGFHEEVKQEITKPKKDKTIDVYLTQEEVDLDGKLSFFRNLLLKFKDVLVTYGGYEDIADIVFVKTAKPIAASFNRRTRQLNIKVDENNNIVKLKIAVWLDKLMQEYTPENLDKFLYNTLSTLRHEFAHSLERGTFTHQSETEGFDDTFGAKMQELSRVIRHNLNADEISRLVLDELSASKRISASA
jgi:hypothetical protein